MENEKLYRIEEIAEILRIKKQTVYDRIRAGHLRAEKYGKIYLISQSALDEHRSAAATRSNMEVEAARVKSAQA